MLQEGSVQHRNVPATLVECSSNVPMSDPVEHFTERSGHSLAMVTERSGHSLDSPIVYIKPTTIELISSTQSVT